MILKVLADQKKIDDKEKLSFFVTYQNEFSFVSHSCLFAVVNTDMACLYKYVILLNTPLF